MAENDQGKSHGLISREHPGRARPSRAGGDDVRDASDLQICQEARDRDEGDSCNKVIRAKIQAASWDQPPHSYNEQTHLGDGRIVVPPGKPCRLKKKFSNFLLHYTRELTLAVVEAKSDKGLAGRGLQQAKDHAAILGLNFAYATNGTVIIEYDCYTAQERLVDRFPTPVELWARYQTGQGLDQSVANSE